MLNSMRINVFIEFQSPRDLPLNSNLAYGMVNASTYEREIRDILGGKEQAVRKYASKIPEKSDAIMSLIESPFYVTRSAGSFGADVIAIRHDFSMVIEVKSSVRPYLMFSEGSGKKQEQANRINDMCIRAGIFLTYAYRIKNVQGDPWRLFVVESKPVGRFNMVYEIIPKIAKTREGNYVMKWEDGLPLSSFIEIINKKVI